MAIKFGRLTNVACVVRCVTAYSTAGTDTIKSVAVVTSPTTNYVINITTTVTIINAYTTTNTIDMEAGIFLRWSSRDLLSGKSLTHQKVRTIL